MGGSDRTKEFFSAAFAFRQDNRNANQSLKKKSKQNLSYFAVEAKKVGQSIGYCVVKLGQMKQYVKRRGLYVDANAEINKLQYSIKEDLTSLKKQIENLTEIARTSSNKGRQSRDHMTLVLSNLTKTARDTSKDFEEILKSRTKGMKASAERRGRFGQSRVNELQAPLSLNTPTYNDSQRMHQVNDPISSSNLGLTQSNQLIPDTNYTQSRVTEAKHIEATIVEMGDMFQELGDMILQQEEDINTTYENVEVARQNVIAGRDELMKYWKTVSSNRALIFKIFLVLISLIVFFNVFLI